jgi:hypothetical protein
MTMISLKYEVADINGQAIDTGILQCDVSSIEESYYSSNALELLEPLFIPGNADGTGWTIDTDTFKTKIIVGTQTNNPQGGTDLLGFIKATAFDQGIADLQTFLDNANVDATLTPTDAKAVITFKRNAEHDGQEDRPLDYFSVVSGYLPNRVSDLELQGYRVATADADAVTFKIGCYLPISLPDADVSYIHIQ